MYILTGLYMKTKSQFSSANAPPTHIGKWGNSLAFRIPKHIAEQLGLNINDTVICSVENGKLVLEPVREPPDYTLDELLAEVVETSEELSWGKPEGQEVW